MEPTTLNIPVLALRGLTVFPHMNLTFDVERSVSIAALERAMETGQDIFLVTQREIGVDQPEEKDLYVIGTVSHISQILRLSSSSVRCVVEGRQRARLRRLWQTTPFLQANVELIEETEPSEAFRRSPRTEALLRQTWNLFSEYAELAGGIPEEVITTVMDSRDVAFLADFITQNIALRHTDKQENWRRWHLSSVCGRSMPSWRGSAMCWASSMRWRGRSAISWPAPSAIRSAHPDPGPPARVGRRGRR